MPWLRFGLSSYLECWNEATTWAAMLLQTTLDFKYVKQPCITHIVTDYHVCLRREAHLAVLANQGLRNIRAGPCIPDV
jgi:hypothetical protein